MCEQPKTNMVSGFFMIRQLLGGCRLLSHFAALPFAGRLKTKFAYKKAACTLKMNVQAAFGD